MKNAPFVSRLVPARIAARLAAAARSAVPGPTARVEVMEERRLMAAGDLDVTSVLGDTGDNWADTVFDMAALPDDRFVLGVTGIRRDRYDSGDRQTVSESGFGLTFVGPDGSMSTEMTSEPDTPMFPTAVAALPDGNVVLVGSGNGSA